MKKILILQLRPEKETADDEYRAFLEHGKFTKSETERIRMGIDILPNDLDLDNYSAIIIGGGPQNIIDPEDKKSDNQKSLEKSLFALLDKVVRTDFPLLGACLGIGLLVTHQNGTLTKKYGESVAAVNINITEEGKKDPIFNNVPDTFTAYVGHKEACDQLPSSATLLASGNACPVQMFRVKENIYATQFHPELDLEGVKTRVKAYNHLGYFPPEEGDKIIADAEKEVPKYAGKILENFIIKYHK